ncbi:MAG: hypothetical protein WCO56_26810 [Verrucomicrobiota bacterium]
MWQRINSWRWTAALLLAGAAAATAAGEITLFNVTPAQTPALAAALQAAALSPQTGNASAPVFRGSLILWEARARGGKDFTPESAQGLGEWTRQGGQLLLTLSEDPGTGPMRLAFMLPITGWQTQGQAREGARKNGEGVIGEQDAELFPRNEAANVPLGFYYPLRPFSAVERGEGRYEYLERTIPYVELPVPPGNTFWTRPLLNRDWRVRARAQDAGKTPVLLTGRYGAGRVAVCATSIAAAGAEAGPLWSGVLRWLMADDPATPTPTPAAATPLPTPLCTVDAERRLLHVALLNPGGQALPVRVVLRLRTWERALVGDVEQALTVPANSQAVAELPLPKPSATGYQALEFRDAFDGRLGILSADGRTLLQEVRVPMDLRPPLLLTVTTDNLRAAEYPFNAPGPQTLAFPNRMGMEVNAYAFKPGQMVNATVVVANGLRNLAPLAKAQDETQPGNASAMALNDEAAFGEQGPNPDKIPGYGAWTGQAGRENVLRFEFATPATVAGVELVGSPELLLK